MAAQSRQEQVLVDFILLKFDELTALLAGMNDDDANTQPQRQGTNSVVQLVVHSCGMLRRWSASVNLGVAVPRDRDAEFTASMLVAEALELARATREAFLTDVAATDFSAAPAAVPPGREIFWTGSCHGVLLHVLEELSQHLGHAEITRDVVVGP